MAWQFHKSAGRNILLLYCKSWGSLVSIVTELGMDNQGSIPGRGRGLFLFATASKSALESVHPPSYQTDTGGSFPGGQADHSPPSRTEVKNAYSYASTPPYVFTAWCLIKYMDNFTFTYFQSHKDCNSVCTKYEGVSKSSRTGRLERELKMVQLSAARCSCIAILWVSLVNFAAVTLCVASHRVFIVVISLWTQSGNF
jgi:hypothetical protein